MDRGLGSDIDTETDTEIFERKKFVFGYQIVLILGSSDIGIHLFIDVVTGPAKFSLILG